MKRLTVIMLILALLIPTVAIAAYKAEKKVGDISVGILIDKNPPVVGDNNITVKLKDSSGKAITDAKVIVNYSMSQMPGMPPMNYKTEATRQREDYTAKINLSMSGPWEIKVIVVRTGKKDVSAKFNVDAR